MATWQYTVYLLPKKQVDEKYGNSCKVVEEEFLENFTGWKIYPQDAVTHIISEGFGSPQSTNYGPIIYGKDDGSCVKLIKKGSSLEDITIRLDLRESVRVQIETILKLCDLLEGVFISPKLDVLKCDRAALIASIKKSDALRFVKNPQFFLESLE